MPITKRTVGPRPDTSHPHYVPAVVPEPGTIKGFDPHDPIHVAAYRIALCEKALVERAHAVMPTADVHIHRGRLRDELLKMLVHSLDVAGDLDRSEALRISTEP